MIPLEDTESDKSNIIFKNKFRKRGFGTEFLEYIPPQGVAFMQAQWSKTMNKDGTIFVRDSTL